MASAALETAAAGPDVAAPATIQAAKQLARFFVEAALQASADELGPADAHIGSPGNGSPQPTSPERRPVDGNEGSVPKRRKLASVPPPEQTAIRSAYFGVSWQNRSRKWKARIQHEGRTYHLGLFAEERLARRLLRLDRLIGPSARLLLHLAPADCADLRDRQRQPGDPSCPKTRSRPFIRRPRC